MIHIEGENNNINDIDNKQVSPLKMNPDGGPVVGGMNMKSSPGEEGQDDGEKSSEDESLQDGVDDDPDAL